MPKDLVESFRAGDELTADLVDAILRELRRLRKMSAAPPLGIFNAEGMAPPTFYLVEETSDLIVPFKNDTGVDVTAGSIATPYSFTATLLFDGYHAGPPVTYGPDLVMQNTIGGVTSAKVTIPGQHVLNVVIKAGASGWGIYRNGYFYPVSWDSC